MQSKYLRITKEAMKIYFISGTSDLIDDIALPRCRFLFCEIIRLKKF
jgi:hypothetical protein